MTGTPHPGISHTCQHQMHCFQCITLASKNRLWLPVACPLRSNSLGQHCRSSIISQPHPSPSLLSGSHPQFLSIHHMTKTEPLDRLNAPPAFIFLLLFLCLYRFDFYFVFERPSICPAPSRAKASLSINVSILQGLVSPRAQPQGSGSLP